MDWRSNFDREELRQIDKIIRFQQQMGYDPGSRPHIIYRMASILDSAQGIINAKHDPSDQWSVRVGEHRDAEQFLDQLGDVAGAGTLKRRIENVVTHYVNQMGRWHKRTG